MEEMNYSLAFLSLLFLFLLSKLITKPYSSHKSYNLPPSPPKLPIIGNLHQLGETPHRTLLKLSEKYGPIMLIHLGQIPTIVVSTRQTAKQVLQTYDSLCCSRPRSYGLTKLSYNEDLSFGAYNSYWRDIKKLFAQEFFSPKRVQSLSHVREREVSCLINSIAESAALGKNPIEIDERVFSLSNNFFCRVAIGRSCEEAGKFLGENYGNKLGDAIHDALAVMSPFFWTADVYPVIGWAVDELKGLHKRMDRVFNALDTFFERAIEEHLDDKDHRPISEHKSALEVLLGILKEGNSLGHLSRAGIKPILMNIFIGAVETSADTIVWAMTELIRNPRAMRKAQLEIRSHIGDKPFVPESEINNLKYLKMVVKETSRMHPLAPLLARESEGKSFAIENYDVPPKTRIYVNVWAIGMDPEAWENPDEFRPERFEESAVDFKGQHFELIPFGAGRRMCPGIVMGASVVELVLANLLHRFDWELPAGVRAEDVSVEEGIGLSTHKKYPLHLVPTLAPSLNMGK